MMGKTAYFKAKEMLEGKQGEILNLSKLRSMIIMNAGIQERTISQYLKIMLETNLIKDVGTSRFEVL